MGLRDTMNNNPAAVTGAAVVVLLLCLVLVYCQFTGGGTPSGKAQIIYFDVESQTIKLVPLDYENPPNSPLDDSPSSFEAMVFSCTECPEDGLVDGMSLKDLEAKGMFIGWLQKRDPDSIPDPSFNASVQFRTLNSKTWYPGDSERWRSIEEKIQQNCPGGAWANACYPPLID